MKHEPNRPSSAFTFVELLVMLAVIIFVAAALILPQLASTGRPSKSSPTYCRNNLRSIAIAYYSWAEDNGDLLPSKQSVAKGGWADFLTNADQGAMCWTNYAILGNELGQNPELLICPCDERQPAFSLTNQFSNTNVSYFVGVSASINQPQSILGGDRNLGPGAIPSNDYGYSPKTGKETTSPFQPVHRIPPFHGP